MGEFPRIYTPRVIHTWTEYFPLGRAAAHGLSPAPASGTWVVSDRALYIPFSLPWDYPVRRLMWANGTVLTGNGCASILDEAGRLLVTTGAIARTPASSPQWTSVTTTWLMADTPYWLGVAAGTTTNALQLSTAVTAIMARMMGIKEQTASNPIPATATFNVPASAGYPLAGFSRVP